MLIILQLNDESTQVHDTLPSTFVHTKNFVNFCENFQNEKVKKIRVTPAPVYRTWAVLRAPCIPWRRMPPKYKTESLLRGPQINCITPWGIVDEEIENRLDPTGSMATKEEDKTFKASDATREELVFNWQTGRPSGQIVDVGGAFAIHQKYVSRSLTVYFWSSISVTFLIS